MSEKKKEDLKRFPFYKLHDWILEELGADTDAIIIAIIYSFYESERKRKLIDPDSEPIKCKLSYSTLSKWLKKSRRQTMARVQKLTDNGYISVKKTKIGNSKESSENIYTVNTKKFPYYHEDITGSAENNTTNIIGGAENSTTGSVEISTTGSVEISTTGSAENSTLIDNIKEKQIEIVKRECVTPPEMENLVYDYGEETINKYRYKYKNWCAKKGILPKNEENTIRQWLERDNISKRDHSCDKYLEFVNVF